MQENLNPFQQLQINLAELGYEVGNEAEVINSLYGVALQAHSNREGLAMLIDEGHNLYEYVHTINLRYQNIFTAETVNYLHNLSLDDVNILPILKLALNQYISQSVANTVQYINETELSNEFWNLQEQSYLTEYNGDNFLDKYYDFRRQILSTMPNDLKSNRTAIGWFDHFENKLSINESRLLFDTIDALHKAGISIEQYIQLRTGLMPNEIIDDLNKVLATFTFKDSRTQYINRFAQHAALGGNTNDFTMENLHQKVDNQFEVDVSDLKFVYSKKVSSGIFYIVPNIPELPEHLQHLWADKQGDVYFFIVNEHVNANSEAERTVLHELGHAANSMQINEENEEDIANNITQVSLINEIFAILSEFNVSDKKHWNNVSRFFIARYAALGLHELKLWNLAEQHVRDKLSIEDFYEQAGESYSALLGQAVNADVVAGRFARDSTIDRSSFFRPLFANAAYVYGYLIATSMQNLTPQQLKEKAYEFSRTTDVKQVLSSLGTTIDKTIKQFANLIIE